MVSDILDQETDLGSEPVDLNPDRGLCGQSPRRPCRFNSCNEPVETFEFFLNNTNLTFLAFLYKIGIEGFQNQQKKLPPPGIELTTPTPLLEFQLPYPLSQSASPCQSQTFRPL